MLILDSIKLIKKMNEDDKKKYSWCLHWKLNPSLIKGTGELRNMIIKAIENTLEDLEKKYKNSQP